MEIRELNHVALHVADVESSCEFYRTVLQLEQLPRPEFSFPGAWFRLGAGQELHLIGGRSAELADHGRRNHYALLVDDMPAWVNRLEQSGVVFEGPLSRPDGARQVFLQDPDGHFIELCTSPPS